MTNYTTINHEARKKLNLSWLEYGLADLIYNLANNPKSTFPGWCYASKETLAEMLGTSKQTVHKLLNKLENQKLIERNIETKHIKVTIDWYKTVVIKDSKESLPMVKKVYPHGKESLPLDSKQSLHNKDIRDKDINNITKVIDKQKVYGNENINFLITYFKEKFQLPELDLSLVTNRRYAYHLIRKSKTGVQGVKWLIDLAASDPWHKSHITSFRDLWNNKVKIMSAGRLERSKYVDLTNIQ